MDTVKLKRTTTHLPSDTFTPVGIYLRLRDFFPQALLLECTDYSSRHEAFSFICLKPLTGIEILNNKALIRKDMQVSERIKLRGVGHPVKLLDKFLNSAQNTEENAPGFVSPIFGYTSYDAVNYFDNVNIQNPYEDKDPIPLIKYDLYQLVIAFNHFNDTLAIHEFLDGKHTPQSEKVLSLLANRNPATFPFRINGDEQTNISPGQYMEMAAKGIEHCKKGDLMQIVFSRQFSRRFNGDEFNVYRALRSINPSPYLFFFDYMDFKLFGSSPETQLQVSKGKATINPIAGTVNRTGDNSREIQLVNKLLDDPKENSEHSMLVDLARNDLSRHSKDVTVEKFRQVHTYSHVIHLVSVVSGKLKENTELYRFFADTFPAGTLTGAPKHRAMQLIDRYETTPRGFYGGAIGYIDPSGNLNHAIMIRSFLSRRGELFYQAGAGIVVDSSPENELKEVNGKLEALRNAIREGENFNKSHT